MKRKHNSRLLAGFALVSLFALLGFVVPFFSPEDPRVWNTVPRNLPASAAHLLGTTSLGQDTFWFLTWAIRNSLIIGLITAVLATVIGLVVGLTAGFRGGTIDRVLTLLMDSFIVIPSLPILILLASLMKGRASIILVAGVLVIFNWPWPARQARASALSLRERDFVHTAWFSGESPLKITMRELLPFISSWALGNLINTVLVAVATEGALAVIGVSNQAQATLGTMIFWAMQHQALLAERWLWIGSPVVAIMLLFIGLFLTQTGLSQYSATKRGR